MELIDSLINTQRGFFNAEDPESYDIKKVNFVKMVSDKDALNVPRTFNNAMFLRKPFQADDILGMLEDEFPTLLNFIRSTGLILAGGSIARLADADGPHDLYTHDFDLFICPSLLSSRMTANGTKSSDYLLNIIEYVRRKFVKIVYNGNTITCKNQEDEYVVQIILREYTCISQLLHGFDIGSACAAFDGNSFYMTGLGHFAFKYGYNIVDMAMRSTTYEARLAKYHRLNFGIIFPKMDMKNVKVVSVHKDKYIVMPFMIMNISDISGSRIYTYTVEVAANMKANDYDSYDITNIRNFILEDSDLAIDMKYVEKKWIPANTITDNLREFYSIVKEYATKKNITVSDAFAEVVVNFEKGCSEYTKRVNDKIYVNVADPTTQKFGMINPADTTDAEWYGELLSR